MAERALDVWCFGELAGHLTDALDGPSFTYTREWIERNRPPLSQSLPLTAAFVPGAAAAFFGGLLPEGTPRQTLARQLGVSADNDFSLLAALGGDTAGAISVVVPGDAPPDTRSHDVRWLDDAELAAEIHDLPIRPMHADDEGEYRLSLAGAQDKLPVVVGPDGRVGLTRGGAPSTHIMKTPIAGLEHTVANEALCLDLGRRLNIPTVTAAPRHVGDTECLLVERYDREAHAGGVVDRLHQEDFCQALGVPTARKYQAEGGPTLADCFALVRRASSLPARDVVRLLDDIVLSFLVANHDAHGKNYSLLYTRDGTGVAPAYDVLSTFVYRGARRMSRKMAMSIGGEYRADYVAERHLDRLLNEAGVAPAAARRRIAELAARAPDEAAAARAALAGHEWDAPILGRIVDMVAQRAGWLAELARPKAGRVTVGAPGAVTTGATVDAPVVSAPDIHGAAVRFTPVLQRLWDAIIAIDLQDDDESRAAAARALDEAVDEFNTAFDALSAVIWECIGAVDAGTGTPDVVGLAPVWRAVASQLHKILRRTTEETPALHRVSDLAPWAGIMATALERLEVADRAAKEWDARLAAFGIPEAEHDEVRDE